MIYEPVEDTFLLKKHIKDFARGKVLDMGSGSGILAEEALKYSNNVLAADINKEAVKFCRKKKINCIYSDLFSNIKEKFDLIIFNPPYLPKKKYEDEETSLNVGQGKELITEFLNQAKSHLNENGQILILISSLTGKPENLFGGWNFKLIDSEKYFFEELFIYLLSGP